MQIAAGLTFKAFEWQAVLASRVLAGRAHLPPRVEQEQWEMDRIKVRGNGPKFTALFPEFQEYFETIRNLAGNDGPGRPLPPFDAAWMQIFEAGHQKRIARWRSEIVEALQQGSFARV